MYIEEIVLDGFKTYMNRTVISGFDSQFNAITGFNGSGKSNILDGIQFVLGSTSKEMLRLKTGLTELIYKEGFAGIEKASVSITFRCKEKHFRPTGYENCEQLVVTRQITKEKITKFFINGQNSNMTKVKNMFRSVQLNIDNPHFLVKQGQITKIINLKPLQLLGMIEQTAGTAYYNKTRSDSQRIISKKEQKLYSINEILESTIRPQMEKLQIDRKKYAVFKDKQVLAQRLNQKIRRHEYAMKLLQTRNNEYKSTTLKETLEGKESQTKELGLKLVAIENQMKILKTKGDAELIKDYNNLNQLIQQQESQKKRIKERLKKIQDESLNIKEKTVVSGHELQRLKQEIQWYQKQSFQVERQVDEFADLLNDLGKSNTEEQTMKLLEKQIQREKSVVANLNDEINLLQSKKQTIQTQQKNQHNSLKEAEESISLMSKIVIDLERDIQKFKQLQKPVSIQDPQLNSQQLRRLQNQKQKLISLNYRIPLHFRDPYQGFNRKLVRGRLFNVFKVKERIHEKALQIGLGNRISQIVIENDDVSQALLKNNCFEQQFVTFIPNNKIRGIVIKQEAIQYAANTAKQLGGFAKPALDLIEYPQDLKNSIVYGFGAFLVCSSPQIASAITGPKTPKQFRVKCVTLDGDMYDPGTVTGGSDNNIRFILPLYREVRQIDGKINLLKGDFQQKNKRYSEYNSKINQYNLFQKQIQAKINRRDKFNQKISSLKINSKPRDYREELEGIAKRIDSLKKQLNEHANKINELTSKTKKGGLKSIEEQKKSLLIDKKKCEQKLSQAKKKISISEVEMEQILNNIKISDETQRDYQKQIIELQRKHNELAESMKSNKSQFSVLEQRKIQQEKEVAINNSKYRMLEHELQQINTRYLNNQDAMKNLRVELEVLNKQMINNQKLLKNLVNENPWIQNQKQIEIEPDFDYHAKTKQFNQLLIDVDKLRKTVKVNVDDHSYQKLNEQYRELLQKKTTLQKDKITLLSNVYELDSKRTKTLEQCIKVVKENLGVIFNDLLPGATAHLNFLDDADVTKKVLNLEFTSTTLKSGQRSLLALSFILALLLYKPAPFYILDQIDSALDLSHTQNIGYMISKRFPQSQFLLISLKQGMYQNANVLYQVHFTQGESKVNRSILKKKIQRF